MGMEDFEEKEKYNFIFNQIVENADDFVGSMAYVLYKFNKIEYIEQYKREHDNKEPELHELREWQKSECAKSKLNNYKSLAQQKTTEFVNHLQNDKERQLMIKKAQIEKKEGEIRERERNVKQQEKNLKERSKYCHVKQKGQFLLGVLQSFLASLAFVVFSFIAILCLSDKTDFVKWLMELLKK